VWQIEKVQVRDSEFDHPWFSQFSLTYGSPREQVSRSRPRVWHPPTDVYETDSHVMVKVEAAGVSQDDFRVWLNGRDLAVGGRRNDPGSKLAYQQMEISYGEFRSDVYLPCDVDETAVGAQYDNGFLLIMLPKAQREHKVPVVVVIQRDG